MELSADYRQFVAEDKELVAILAFLAGQPAEVGYADIGIRVDRRDVLRSSVKHNHEIL